MLIGLLFNMNLHHMDLLLFKLLQILSLLHIPDIFGMSVIVFGFILPTRIDLVCFMNYFFSTVIAAAIQDQVKIPMIHLQGKILNHPHH